MKSQNIALIPFTTYGVPSGNYNGSSLTFTSDRQKASNYYRRSANSQTLRFTTDEFVGEIVIQASLDSDPTVDTDWFDVYTFPGDSATDGSTAISSDYATGVAGRFTWIRAVVTGFTDGTINSVTLTY